MPNRIPQCCPFLPYRLLSTTTRLPGTLSYHVPRNSRGSLPVYSDIRNRSRYLIQVRNIEGDPNTMLRDLCVTLFPPGSQESNILRGRVVRSKHLILQGPGRRWKANVVDWLKNRGF